MSTVQPQNPLHFADPQAEIQKIIVAGQKIKAQQPLTKVVIGVSGGVDSSFSLYLAKEIFGLDKTFPFLLPYGEQSIKDAELACQHLGFPASQVTTLNIQPLVQTFQEQIINQSNLTPASTDTDLQIQRGNAMARIRMMILFHFARLRQALVLGTENLSEKNLGYFTLFGDSASSIELIDNLYKTQVVQLATSVLPPQLAHRPPSAELWSGQTDENELGFTYDQADRIMSALWPQEISDSKQKDILLNGIDQATIEKVLTRCRSQEFKQQIPYHIANPLN